MCLTHLLILLYLSVKFDQIPFIGFLVVADTGFGSDKLLTFGCDLDLGCGNLNFVHDTPSRCGLSFSEID